MPNVYRVETADPDFDFRVGPYITSRGVCGRHTGYASHRPSPFHDGLNGVAYWDTEHRFAFRCLGALRAWFCEDEVRQILHEQGYVVAVYEVPEDMIHDGRRQCVFGIECAVHVVDIPLTDALRYHPEQEAA